MISRHYTASDSGQLHYWQYIPPSEPGSPLLCLHPAPFSGLFFTTAMPWLAEQRRVIAPDYPGYGGSAPPAAQPAIADYARSILQLLEDEPLETPVYLLGFHTGCLVAAELALQAPEMIAGLVLVDVPFFDPQVQAGMLEKAARPMNLSGDAESVAPYWQSSVAAKLDAVPGERAIALFAEQLRAHPNSHWAFHAAFSYPCEQQFSRLQGPVSVIATRSALFEASLACAQCIPAARLQPAEEITRAVFEEGAEAIAGRINLAIAEMEEAPS